MLLTAIKEHLSRADLLGGLEVAEEASCILVTVGAIGKAHHLTAAHGVLSRAGYRCYLTRSAVVIPVRPAGAIPVRS